MVAVYCLVPSRTTYGSEKEGMWYEPGPHCGMYCVYAAAKYLGKDIRFVDLVTPEYISSARGSSLANLRKAAEDNGLYAVPLGKLSSRVLRNCPYPVILHVKPDRQPRDYTHYELLLTARGGQAMLLDPPEPVRQVPLHRLAPRWDGSAVIISAEPIKLRGILAPERRWLAMWMTVAVAGVMLLRLVRRCLLGALFVSWHRRFGLSVGQGVAVGATAVVLACVYHCVTDEGFLTRADATIRIQQAHAGDFIPKVNSNNMNAILRGNSGVVIDARFRRDYDLGHLEGAISVPIDANDARRGELTASISKDSKVVVYCQSRACQYAENVAVWLQDNGFSDVVVYRGGWVDWVAKNGKKNTEGAS